MEALRRNWKAKLGSLALASVVWWLIKMELYEPVPGVEELALPPQTVREL